MRIQLWTFRTDSYINIPDTIAFSGNQVYSFTQQYLAVDIESRSRRIRKVIAYITHISGSKQRITDGMYEHISVTMT